MSNYFEIEGLENFYFEDSFVLKIEESKYELTFLLDLVLKEEHPLYSDPKDDEQYCYKKARLIFRECEEINWIEKINSKFSDKSGEVDLGNIDSFRKDDKENHLEGDWGEVILVTDLVEVFFV